MIDYPGGEKDIRKALALKQSKYGLGDRRSLDQLFNFSGVDVRNKKKSIDGKNRCGNISWVPFHEHPKGVNYIPSFDDKSEAPLDLPYDPTSVWFVPDIDKKIVDENDQMDAGDLQDMHAALQEDIKADDKSMSVKQKDIDDEDDIKMVAGNELQNQHEELFKNIIKEKVEEVIAEKQITSNAEALHLDEKIIKIPQNRSEPARSLKTGKGKMIRGFLVKHHFIRPEDHGIHNLPPVILCSVLLLFLGLIVSIAKSTGTGRSLKTVYK